MTVIHGGELFFLEPGGKGVPEILHAVPVDELLSGDSDAAIPRDMPARGVNTLLVVPDYWVGSAVYRFQSSKRALAESFIKRKLAAENPEIPEVTRFFDFSDTVHGTGERDLWVCFLQETQAYAVYSRLERAGFAPRRITTPAFLWNRKISRHAGDVRESGQCLVHASGAEWFLYFFDQGRFLFSRSIAGSGSGERGSEAMESLAYEINQSLYLFSQKTKVRQIRFFVVSPEASDAPRLARLLEREVLDFSESAGAAAGGETGRRIPVVSAFEAQDLNPAAQFQSLVHSRLKKELEWKPVRSIGVAIGVITLVVLALEALFLHHVSLSKNVRLTRGEIQTQRDAREVLHRYGEALDRMIRESRRPSLRRSVVRLAESLPPGARIANLAVDLADRPRMEMKAVVTAENPNEFRILLSMLLDGLKRNFGGHPDIRIRDVDFEVWKNKADAALQDYHFELGFDLP